MSMVWPCPLTVDAYAAMGRRIQRRGPIARMPRARGVLVGLLAACPLAGAVPGDLRAAGQMRWLRGDPCAAPGVQLAWRLDVAGRSGR